MDLAWNGQETTIEKRGTGKWWITRPKEARACSRAVTPILSGLSSMEGTAFHAKPEAPEGMKRYGLDPPLARVTLYEAADAMEPVPEAGQETPPAVPIGSLLLGQVGEQGTGRHYYAYREGAPTVAEVGETFFVQDLPKDVESLVDKRVMDFFRYQVASVEIRTAKGDVLVEKKDGTWEMKRPQKRGVKVEDVDDLLDWLSDLKVDRFLPFSEKGEPEGMEDPFGPDASVSTVTLRDELGAELATASFAASEGPADEPDARFVRIGGTREPGLIGKDRTEELRERILKIEGKG